MPDSSILHPMADRTSKGNPGAPTALPPVSDDRYLDLLKRVLTGLVRPEMLRPLRPAKGTAKRWLLAPIQGLLRQFGIELARRVAIDPEARADGKDWPAEAETMIGLKRLDNLQACIEDVVRAGIPGDIIETGVWRGGAAIFARAALEVLGDTERAVWVADSFRGLPRPRDGAHPLDARDDYRLWSWTQLAVPREEVERNFARYSLLDARVRFLEGWFEDTLPAAPIERLAILRLDGDLYSSTMVALRTPYSKLSVGGYVIVDDYGAIEGCKQAVHNFRGEHGITEEFRWIDWAGVYWRRER